MQGEPSLAIEVVEVVALPTTEPEYMVVVEVGKEIIWPRDFNSYLGMWQEQFLQHCDNQSDIHLAKNAAYYSKTNHI